MSIETNRLWLRPLGLEDARAVQSLFPKWEVVRLLAAGVPWPFPEDGVEQYYRNAALPAMERGDEWHWTLRLKTAPDQPIGAISLLRNGPTNRGFWMGLDWQGQGLMSEACVAVTDYWFEVLRFPLLRVQKAASNEKSRRISERQGMRLAGVTTGDYVSGKGMPTEIWEISAEEWAAWRRSGDRTAQNMLD